MSLTDWLAIYAAALSTTVFVWNLVRATPKAKTTVVFGMDKKHRSGIYVNVQNRSPHAIHLASISLLYEYRSVGVLERLKHMVQFKQIPRRIGWVHSSLSLHGVKDGCPVQIQPMNSHDVFVPDSVLRSILSQAVSTRIAAVAQDRLWNNSYSGDIDYKVPKRDENNEA